MIRYLTELSLDAFIEAARNIPYQQIQSELFPGIDLWIRRDDLIDPLISGNKAYKLIYNLLEAKRQGKDSVVTCGGAWSNHIHATAAAGRRFGFKTVGIIRGERPTALSSMLQDAERFGMELRFVSRSLYRERAGNDFLRLVGIDEDASWFVPEGGANEQGAEGVRLLGRIIEETKPALFGEYWVACGTGLTLGALASTLQSGRVVGAPVLKALASIRKNAVHWASVDGCGRPFDMIGECHRGGYAKVDTDLLAFRKRFESLFNVPVDHVYTAKLLHALVSRSKANVAQGNRRQSRILFIHTGGLQGSRGLIKS